MSASALAEFLAHSVELETEARERYQELAAAMTAHHNEDVAGFFLRMADEALLHLQEVLELAADTPLPTLKPWEFEWPDVEPPETASYEAVHYRMSIRQAVSLALANERAAEHYYRGMATSTDDKETASVATRFADEELLHAAELEKMLLTLPQSPGHGLEEDDDPHMPE